MKNFRVSALLLLCVVALFGWLWWREREPALPPGVQVVARFAPENIARIVLKNEGQPTLQLSREGDAWKIVPQVLAGQKKPVAVFADGKRVKNFLNAFAVLRSDVVLKADQKAYGLNAPRVTVELDGQSIAFGAPPFFDARRVYARVDNQIALLPRVLAQAAARPLDDWRDHNIARFDVAQIKQLKLTNRQKIVLKKTRDTEIAPTIGGENWLMNGPVFEPADSEHIVALLQMLQAAQVQKFLEIGSENWGFEQPTAQIGFNGAAPLLTIGRKTQSGYAAYGRVKAAPFVVEASVVQRLLRPANFWRSHRLLSFDLNDINRVNLRARGEDLVFVRDGARWKRQNSNAPDSNADVVADILVAARDWRATDFAYPSDAGTIVFRLAFSDGKNDGRGVEIWRVGKQWRARVLGLPVPPRPFYVLPDAAVANLNVLVERLLAPTPTPAPAKVGPRL